MTEQRMSSAHDKPAPARDTSKSEEDAAPPTSVQSSATPREASKRSLPSPLEPAAHPTFTERGLRLRDAFHPLASARAQVKLVIVTAKRGPRLVNLSKPPSKWEIIHGAATLYEVDTGLHHTSVEFGLPASGNIFRFQAMADIEWRVEHPTQVVKDALTDIREALVPEFHRRLSVITREYPVDEVAAAERAITAELATSDPGISYGLSTRIAIRLWADRGTIQHAMARRELEQQLEIETLRQDVRHKQERNDQSLLRARMDIYRNIIAGNDVERFSMQLARNPDDVESVMRLFREERVENMRLATEFITHLLDSGAIERWDIEDRVRETLRWIQDAVDRIIPTIPALDETKRPARSNE